MREQYVFTAAVQTSPSLHGSAVVTFIRTDLSGFRGIDAPDG